MKKLYLKLLFPLLGLAPFAASSQVLYLQDFDHIGGPTAGGPGTYNFAPGFLLRNVDNRTPAASVSYVNEAWERRDDFNFNIPDSAAFSTSWYSPAGAANDWMWTPLIGPLPANATLSWNSVTYDVSYPDGYEVRVMVAPTVPTGGAGVIGNQITNSTVVFSIAAESSAWTAHSVPLATYTGQSIYVGFRNNSNDKFLLLIDDIKVEVPLNNDLQLVSVDTLTEYTQIPKTQIAPIILGGSIKNGGAMAQTNVTLTAKVFDQSNTQVYSASSTAIPSLAVNATQHVSIASWTPPVNAQNYTVKLYVDGDQTEQIFTNDTLTKTVTISEDVYSRDDATVVGSLGIGAGNGGYLGQDFIINNTGRVSAIGMYFTRGYTGRPYGAVIWDMVAGQPNQIVAVTDTLIYPDDSADYYIVPINGGPFTLNPGRYAITAIEFDSTLALGQTNTIFTTNRTWVDWPTSPITGWANNEDFGVSFSKPYVIRPTILPVCPATLITGSAIVEATCGASNGEASVTVGAGNYTFLWSGGETTSAITNVGAGNYSVTVTNTDLVCTQVVNLTVTNVGAPTLTSITGSTVNCAGDNGTATVVVSGGTMPYTYLWSNGGTTATITGAAGSYSVTVTDANNCTLPAGPVDIIAPTPLVGNSSGTNESCAACNDGSATAAATGGVGPYSYSWAPSGGNGGTATGLDAGTYTVTITDANGCTTTSSVTVGTDASIAEENNNTNVFNVYPNPNSGVFVVTSDIDYSGQAKVEVMDITGKVLHTQNVTLNNSISNTTIYLEYAAKGTYMLRLTTDKDTYFRRIMIK